MSCKHGRHMKTITKLNVNKQQTHSHSQLQRHHHHRTKMSLCNIYMCKFICLLFIKRHIYHLCHILYFIFFLPSGVWQSHFLVVNKKNILKQKQIPQTSIFCIENCKKTGFLWPRLVLNRFHFIKKLILKDFDMSFKWINKFFC